MLEVVGLDLFNNQHRSTEIQSMVSGLLPGEQEFVLGLNQHCQESSQYTCHVAHCVLMASSISKPDVKRINEYLDIWISVWWRKNFFRISTFARRRNVALSAARCWAPGGQSTSVSMK
ncbi:hypothetical protein BgiBS90_002735 [Biomphalaria glabrata]|nr:hypothetical protein BgiBS90_002735 [Biomphalaria glabrata]